MSCEQELCRNWAGDAGCPCAVLGARIEPDLAPCDCCNGDRNLVCDACGDHECWAGHYMCEDSATAGAVLRDEYVRGAS